MLHVQKRVDVGVSKERIKPKGTETESLWKAEDVVQDVNDRRTGYEGEASLQELRSLEDDLNIGLDAKGSQHNGSKKSKPDPLKQHDFPFGSKQS